MNLPSKIRIGAIDYTVQAVRDLHYHDGDERRWLNGRIKRQSCEIEVEENMLPDRQTVTLWHETLHGICEHAGIDDEPENVIIALAFGIVEAMRNNPELVKLTIHQDTPDALQ